MTFHAEVLPESQQRVLRQLGPSLSRAGFVLAGGTAVALHPGHRRSLVLDFSLDAMLGFYQRKFATQDLGHVVMSLTFFDDADEDDAPAMLWPLDGEDVQRTIERWVYDYVHRQTPHPDLDRHPT